jgi:hypothetical protein
LEQLYRIEKAMDNFYLELFPLSALAIFLDSARRLRRAVSKKMSSNKSFQRG